MSTTIVELATRVLRRDDDDGGDNRNCVTVTPGPNGFVAPADGVCNAYYNYDPQFAPALAVAVVFGVLTGIHIFLAILFRKRFAWTMIMGCTWETVAFGIHVAGTRDQQNEAFATVWQIMFLLAPLWINAFVYMTFARMAHYYLTDPDKKIRGVRAASIAVWFVWGDVVTFIIQAVGGVMASPTADANTIKIGLDIYLAGMGLQQFFMFVFLWLMIEFHVRCTKDWDLLGAQGDSKRSWRQLQWALYAVLLFITVRNAFRIAEFAPGVDASNPIIFHEWFQYALDAVPMMIVMVILAVFHPGRFLVGPDSELPKKTRAEKKAEKLARKEAKRVKKMGLPAKYEMVDRADGYEYGGDSASGYDSGAPAASSYGNHPYGQA